MLTKDQCVWIVTQMSKLEHPVMVKNDYKRKFKSPSQELPDETLIGEIFKHFLDTGSIVKFSIDTDVALKNSNKTLTWAEKQQMKRANVATSGGGGDPSKNRKQDTKTDKLVIKASSLRDKLVPSKDSKSAASRHTSTTDRIMNDTSVRRQTSLPEDKVLEKAAKDDATDKYTALAKAFKVAPPPPQSRKSSTVASLGSIPSLLLLPTNDSIVSTYERINKLGRENQKYYLKIGHPLTAEDCDARLQMCEEIRDQIKLDPKFVSKIIFSSQAFFHLGERVDKHNCTICGTDYPSSEGPVRESPYVIVWCGLSRDHIYGPFFFPDSRVTEDAYANMLRTYFLPMLRSRCRVESVIFQNDGEVAQLGAKVRHFLDDKFPKRWLGRRGLVKWAPRSPDLNPVDFYFWGEIKAQVFGSRCRSMADLKDKITTAINTISLRSVETSCLVWERRVGQCLEDRGAFILETF